MEVSKSKIWKAAIVLIILLLPSLFYLFLFSGKHLHQSLPYFGPKKLIEKEGKFDTVYFTIPSFRLLDQDSILFTRDSMHGYIYVVDFFFATCPTICPKMATHMHNLQEKFKDYPQVKFLSITVNPEHDSPTVLNDYAKKVHAGPNWKFLTGEKDSIYNLAFTGFFVSAMKDTLAPGGFLHSPYLILLDKEAHIRGYFDGTSTTETKKLEDALKILLYDDFKAKKKK